MKSLLRSTLFHVVIVALPLLASQAQVQTSRPSQRRAARHLPVSKAEAIRLNNLGTAYMNQQQFERALKLFSSAIANNPKLEIARVNRGIALLNLQRYASARQALSDVTSRDPNSARAWYNLGLTYRALGQSQLALAAFEKSAQLDPTDTDAFYLVGAMQAQLGLETEAIQSFQKSLELAPENASAEFGLARAYQRVNDPSRAKTHLARFDEITKTRQGKLMSPAYGDQGVLSVAAPARGGQTMSPPISVAFADVTAQSGLSLGTTITKNALTNVKPAACFLDYDNDGRPDLLLVSQVAKEIVRFYHNRGGSFEDATATAFSRIPETVTACAAGDFDNDGFTDIALGTTRGVELFRNDGKGHFVDVTAGSGIRIGAQISAVTFVDYDHDGDLDLLIMTADRAAPESTLHLWRNNGNGSFTDVTQALGFDLKTEPGVAGVTDYNNDRASDVLLSGPGLMFVNPREGAWTKVAIEPGALVAGRGLAILDFNKDGWMDIALGTNSGLVLYRNVNGLRFERVNITGAEAGSAYGVAAVDYDNDSWIDLAVVGRDQKGDGNIRLFRNTGPSGFVDVSTQTALDKVHVSSPSAIITADYDGDGDTDLLITESDGKVVLLRNDGGSQNNFLRLSFRGLADNKNAIGTKVEVFAGELWQKWEISPAAYGGQNSTEIIAGLGKEKSVDVVRMLWPTGVVQDEAQLQSRTTKRIGEIDRRGSSCPLLFVWDGRRYRFVADMIGAGVVGHWISPTQKNIPDPTEYIKLEGVKPVPKGGRLSFRFMEPMEEVVYFDQARLLAVDHPVGSDVYPNEYFASNPPFPEFKVIASTKARPPRGAWDDAGRDVLAHLLRRDQDYVTGFNVTKWTGFAEPHSLTLELPNAYAGGPLHLLMNGYIEYFMANSMYAAYQAGIEPFAPYLEAQTNDGRWIRVLDDMGFPAGLRRTITVDLTGKLPPATHRIRLTTNLQIYWDQILFDTTPSSSVPTRITEVPLASAALGWHGYPHMLEASTPGDLTFDYEDVSHTGPYVRQAGSYTRYGEITDLLRRTDDRFVVFGSGDEVQVEFDPGKLPVVPKGWKRDYFFFADGFEKDMDFYAAEGLMVAPLPFHAMQQYPYGSADHYPDDNDHLRYRLHYNTRFESGTWPSSFEFEYHGKTAATQ